MVVLTFHNRSVTVRLQFVYPPPPLTSWLGMACEFMLCCVMLRALYYAMSCYVLLCYVMLCYVMLCYVMLCYAMLCYVTVIRYMYKSFVKCKDFNCTCCKIIRGHCNIFIYLQTPVNGKRKLGDQVDIMILYIG